MAAVAKSIRRSAIGLGLFAVITGGTIAVTQVATEERIREQAARAEAQALYEIIPESRHNNDLLRDTVQLPASERLAHPGPLNVWVARQNEQPIGMRMPVVAPDGYSGKIHLLVGVDMTGTILGVRVTSHKETPGETRSKPANPTGSGVSMAARWANHRTGSGTLKRMVENSISSQARPSRQGL